MTLARNGASWSYSAASVEEYLQHGLSASLSDAGARRSDKGVTIAMLSKIFKMLIDANSDKLPKCISS